MHWFTVVAQIVNFMVLVALLKIFLYKHIIRAMGARQERIASALKEADTKQKEAETQAEALRQKHLEFDGQREEMMAAAKQDAENRRKELTSKAQEDVDRLHARWKQTVRDEKDQVLQQIREAAARHVCDVSRRVLSDLADADLQDQMVRLFLDKVRTLDEARRSEFAQALSGSRGPVTVVSAFDIADGRRHEVTEAVRTLAPGEREVKFELDPQLVCGIALQTGGHSLGWSVDEYLDTLAASFTETLDDAGEEHAGSETDA
jgi:F-type H+-transporting ATPase subunit b